MDINKFEKKSVIKNEKYFSISYPISDETIYLTEEHESYIKSIWRFKNSGFKVGLTLIGSSGIGKTALIKFILKNFKEQHDLNYTYVNCRGLDSSYAISKKLLDTTKRIPRERIPQLIQKKLGKHKTVVVLDEVEQAKEDDILYHLTRDEKLNVFLIIITNDFSWFGSLSPSVRSSLTTRTKYVRKYNANEIYNILKIRCELGLNKYDDNLLQIISALICKLFDSDLRIGINALQIVFNDENKYNTHSKIKNLLTELSVKIILDQIQGLPQEKLLLLHLIGEYDKRSELYKKYIEYFPMSQTYFLKHMKDLERLKFIIFNKIRDGRSFEIEVKHTIEFQKDHVLKIIKQLLTEMNLL